jgi:hypothetical protein
MNLTESRLKKALDEFLVLDSNHLNCHGQSRILVQKCSPGVK